MKPAGVPGTPGGTGVGTGNVIGAAIGASRNVSGTIPSGVGILGTTDDSSESQPNSRNQSTSSVLLSPTLRATSKSKLKKFKLKPHLKRSSLGQHPQHKLIFSVDDDIGDALNDESLSATVQELAGEANVNKKYIEGYADAIRDLQKHAAVQLQQQQPLGGYFPEDRQILELEVESIEEGATPLVGDILEENEDIDGEAVPAEQNEAEVNDQVDADETEIGENGEIDADNDSGSINSISTLESLNLRERQDAINSTHPFGIKIWKPSLYKKKRSVAARAEEDIHDFDPQNPRTPTSSRIFWGVTLTNLIWLLTLGLLMYVICIFGALLVFIFSGFALHRHLRPYVKLLLKLGKYWLFPFGKFVLLNRDENYLDEDVLDGRSITEFHRWRLQEEGRLFYAPPRRFTSSNDSRPVTRPGVVKDQQGRLLSDVYSMADQPGLPSQAHNQTEETIYESDSDDIAMDDENTDIKVRFFGRGSWSLGRFVFYLFFYGILQPFFYLVGLVCWFIVFTIPMAKISLTICDHLRRHPLALDFELEKEFYKRNDGLLGVKKRKHQVIVMCTYRCCGLHYYKYTIDGTNIFFINLLSTVIFVILDYYLLKENFGWKTWYTEPKFVFGLCLFSIIPLAYFIGQAVASISAQSSMGVGAVINAFFSTVVEIFLYCVALNQSKGKLVEGSMIGSILGGVLLLPGLSMIGGAFKRKTQRYNPRSAGVSLTMLLFAMVIMFAPSLFYQIYGAYEIKCKRCDLELLGAAIADDCNTCRFIQPSFSLDPLYYEVLRPFSLIVALALFAAYVTGLIFTLRTHASLIWATSHDSEIPLAPVQPPVGANTPAQTPKGKKPYARSSSVGSIERNITNALSRFGTLPPSALNTDIRGRTTGVSSGSNSGFHSPVVEQLRRAKDPRSLSRRASVIPDVKDKHEEDDEVESGGHDAPNWSRNKSTVILLVATLMYAIIAEILVDTVDAVLADFPINPKFLGLTVFALVPNTTEFLNAISFAIGGNVALSMEIGSAYALQVVLIQIPVLVLYTLFIGSDNVEQMFALVFPRWDIIATLISIYLFTYIYAEGKSNYFKGVILILIYAVVLIGFWFNDRIEALEDGYFGGPSTYGSPSPKGIHW